MMNFGIALLITIACFVVISLSKVLIQKLVKKAAFKILFVDLDNAYRFGLFLILELLFLTFIFISYSRTTLFSIISLGVFTSLAVIFIPFKSLIFKIKEKKFEEINYFKFAGFFGVILILILEVFAFSNVSDKRDSNIVEVPFESSLIIETNGTKEEDKIIFDKQRQYLIINNSNHAIDSIYFDFTCETETRIQVDVCVLNNNGQFAFKKDYRFDPRYSNFEYFDLSEYSNSDEIKFVFVIDETNIHDSSQLSSIEMHQIVINKAFPFVFNAFRFVLLVGLFSLVLLVIFKGKQLKFKEIDNVNLLEKIILLLCGVGLVYVIINALVFSSSHFVAIEDVNGQSSVIYYQLFDAFRKGQFHLDYQPSQSLINLANPYDPSSRTGVSYLWDRAFYGGKYFCYYGAAPVLLVMFPIYLISGMNYVPSILLICELGTLFSITTFLLAILGFVKLMFKKVNMPVLIFTLFGALFTSLLFNNTTFKIGYYSEGIYRIPYAYGLCFFFLVFAMLCKAINNKKYRLIYLAIAGLSVVSMMGSRPTLIYGLLLAIPLLLRILFEKYPWKKKLIDFSPMVGIVLIGAILIAIYNYARFDSMFEFGQSYQLTVADNTKLAYSVEGILPTISQFYIMPPTMGGGFPSIGFGYGDFVERYHVYNAGSIGLLMFPMLWGMFALPFVFDKKDDIFMRIMFYTSPFIVFVLAFTTYCFAGVCPRYVVELTSISMLFSFVPLLKAFEKLYQKKKLTTLFSYGIIVLVSSLISFNLLFASFDGWQEADQHGLLEIIKSIFNQYNI